IYLSGKQDEPGILSDVVEWAQAMNKTIVKDESHVAVTGEFTIAMIVKGLTSAEEEQIKEKLTADSRFTSVTVV
nr:hypothetical protein [Candidatus Woesebacteria bacterium]